jgi:uncharacterized OsmC-like protein/fermentation-respiration switch protein FrsA (DUF1100 family)
MSATIVSFTGTDDHQLSGRLELPLDGKPVAYALFAHCFTCSKDLRAVVEISRALCREGIAVLRFDFTGLGESEGEFADTGFSSNVDDLVAAAEFLAEHHQAPRVLVGHSLGGAAVLRAAARIPSVVAVATIGAPAEPSHVERLLTGSRDQIEADGEAEVELAGRRFRIRRSFLEDLEEHRMQAVIRALRRPLLILHSPRDEVVGIGNAAEIFQAALHPKSFVSLDRADHLLTEARDSRYAGSMIGAWAARYIETPVAETVEELLAERGVATRTGPDGYRTEVRARHHAWVADEPAAVGGADTGPTPYELLAASLGVCTSMTLRMYADRKGWPLEEATVRLQHRRVHALDEEQCERRTPRLDQIERVVEVRGPLSPEQRARLMEIADRCPVHRTLEAGVRIVTRAGDADDPEPPA